MKLAVLILTAIILFTACKEDKDATIKPVESAANNVSNIVESRNEYISLNPIEIIDSKGNAVLKLNGEHEVLYKGTSAAVLEDGDLKSSSGDIIAKISLAGVIVTSQGEPVAKINEKSQLDTGSGNLIRIGSDGNIYRGEYNTGFKVTPNSSKSYNTALLLSYWFLMR